MYLYNKNANYALAISLISVNINRYKNVWPNMLLRKDMGEIQGQGDKVVIWGGEILSNEFIVGNRVNGRILTLTPLWNQEIYQIFSSKLCPTVCLFSAFKPHWKIAAYNL